MLVDLVRTQSYCGSMKTITTHYTKTHLSRLLKEVQQGEEVIILNGQTPAGRLVALGQSTSRRPAVGTVTSNPVTCEEDAFAPLGRRGTVTTVPGARASLFSSWETQVSGASLL
jgi:antitoxin (DNA-binding transcriptional repressor) of toxin-antitoxin stability system